MQTINIDSLDELPHAAAAVINALEGRSVVVFRGEMGAGKTTLIRDRKSTRLNSSHGYRSRMPSSA